MDVPTEVGSAFRALRRSPQFAAASVLLLALGIGANVVLFSLADAVMFRPFPFKEQNRLVIGAEHLNATRAEVLVRELQGLAGPVAVVQRAGGNGSSNWTLTLRATEPIAVPYRAVSSEFFDVLGVPAALGRTFRARATTRGLHRVLW